MPNSPPVIDALRRLAGAGPDDVSDADLLARFVAAKDAVAFEALVRRHGGLVWGACRRRLRDEHAAEDAFQTTFLALARHAAGIRRPDTLGAWLHRVAVRCTAAFRRQARDAMSAPPPDAPALAPDPAAVAAGRDLERLIDAEIDALPEPFREAFILCEVEERTAPAAARALNCPVGTVESRLTRARARLRERLARRGVTAGALAGLGLGTAPAPATASEAAVAAATGTAHAPALWAVIADRAVGKGVAALSIGFVGGIALVGLGGLVWTLAQSAEKPGPTAPAVRQQAPAEVAIPEPDQFRRNRFNFPLPPEAIARVGDPWLRHGAVAQRLAFSADGRFLATAGPGDRWLRVWDLTAGRPRMHLPLAPGENPAALALSADGATLRAVVHRDERTAQLREYDTYRAQEVRRRPLPAGPATTVAFDADGTQLVETRDGFVRLLSAATAAEVWRTPVPAGTRVDLTVCTATGRVAIVPAGADRVRLLDLATGRPEGELADPGAHLALPTFSADGRRLTAVCTESQAVLVWDTGTRKVVRTINSGTLVVGLALRPDGEEVAVFGSQCPILWPAGARGGRGRCLCDVMGGLTGRYSPGGTLLAVASRSGVVQLFDTKTARPYRPNSTDQRVGPGEPSTPVPVAFSRDGQRLLVRGFQAWQEYSPDEDRQPWVFVPGSRSGEPILDAGYVTAVAPDRSVVARCTAEGKGDDATFGIDLLDAMTAAPVGRIGLGERAHHPAFSPDGRTLYAIAGKVLRGWDVQTGREVLRAKGNAGEVVYQVIASADGRYVATADHVLTDMQRENAIQVWDAVTGEVVLAADGCQARPYVAFSTDGRRFAAVTLADDTKEPGNRVRVWDLTSRRVVADFPKYDGQPAFSPDGRTLAVTREDAVVLLELATGQLRHHFRHHGPVEPGLVWRPDGRVLAAASSEAPVYLWDVAGDRTNAVAAWDPSGDGARWSALAGEDAAAAFQTERELWAHPENAVPFLKARVGGRADVRLASRACEALELIGTADAKELLAAWARGDAESALVKEATDSLRRLSAGTN